MVAAITTYMVIFIQFMPKEDPTKTAVAMNSTESESNLVTLNTTISLTTEVT